jgi:hypothetical protein
LHFRSFMTLPEILFYFFDHLHISVSLFSWLPVLRGQSVSFTSASWWYKA